MIAIIAATNDEVSLFLKRGQYRKDGNGERGAFYRSEIRPNCVVAVGGIGAEGAVNSTLEVIEKYRPTMVVSTGFAGGVQPGLLTGHIVICDTVSQTNNLSDVKQMKSIKIGLPNTRLGRVTIGSCLTVPSAIAEPQTKWEIGRRFNLSIIDMESYWVCKTSNESQVDCIAARVVLDTVDQRLPGVAHHVAARKGSALKYLATHPAELPATLTLWRKVRKARAALTDYLVLLTENDRLTTLTNHSTARTQNI